MLIHVLKIKFKVEGHSVVIQTWAPADIFPEGRNIVFTRKKNQLVLNLIIRKTQTECDATIESRDHVNHVNEIETLIF